MDEITRKARIYKALELHHEAVSWYYKPIMTVLVGSQNYGLDTETSDYDTCTFVLPSPTDIATLRDPVSTTQEDELGHITIKDIRLGLNLLKKTSPNSVEWFATKYKYVEPRFNCEFPPITFRCDTKHMMSAIDGLAHQLGKRNMSAGKRLSHILRMECMVSKYFDIQSDILSMFDAERELAWEAKKDPDNPKWNKECLIHADCVHELVNAANLTFFNDTEEYTKQYITNMQLEFTRLALE